MIPVLAASSGAEWLAIRSTGIVALLLLTLTTALGVAAHRGWRPEGLGKVVTRALHRNVALLSVLFLAIHVVLAVLDSYLHASILDTVIPFASGNVSLALGTIGSDLVLAILLTSALRRHIGDGAWRAVHLTSWGSWGFAIVHGMAEGTDNAQWWMLGLDLLCVGTVAWAAAWRFEPRPEPRRHPVPQRRLHPR